MAFVFYEAPVTSTYFVLRPGYDFLAGEMIGYAETAWPEFDEPRELNLLSGQKTLIEEAEKRVLEPPVGAFCSRRRQGGGEKVLCVYG